MPTIAESKINLIKNTVRKYSNAEIFLFGSTLRMLVTENKCDIIDVIVFEDDLLIKETILSQNLPGVNFLFDNKIDYSHELYTMDTIFAKIDDSFNGNISLQSTNFGVMDISKKIIKLTVAGKQKLLDSPHFILDLITTVANNKFIIDALTITLLLQHRNVVKNIEKHIIYDFLKNISTCKYPRKIISLLNALGISYELFGVSLCETATINHLSHSDQYELLAVVFINLDKKILKTTLFNNGFPPKDIELIGNTIELINSISGESIEDARNILQKVPENRVFNTIRLLNALKFKTLSRFIRAQKKGSFILSNLCITEEIIKEAFNVTDEIEIKRLLDKALEKVILDPTYNDKYKILTYLNKERI